MASNAIPEKLEKLVSLGEDAADGAQEYGAAIGLAQNTEAKIRTDLATLMGDTVEEPPVAGSQETYTAAKVLKTAMTAAMNAAETAGRSFITTAVNSLKYYLGEHWNSAWNVVGFTDGSLAVPKDPLPVLQEMSAYFLVEGERENPAQNVTSAAANAAAQAVSTARSASNASKTALATAKNARDADQAALYHRMTGLRSELEQLLGPDDPRWYAFGFSRPADGEGPGPISTLTLTPVGTGAMVADWSHAIRAERYRVFVKTVGTDPDPVQVASDIDGLTFTLMGLPSGETAEVFIVAANDAGDGPPSPTVSATVP